MKKEELFALIGDINDEILIEAEETEIKNNVKLKFNIKWVSAAAALLLIVGIAFFVPNIIESAKPDIGPDIIDSGSDGINDILKADGVIWDNGVDNMDGVASNESVSSYTEQMNGWKLEYKLWNVLQAADDGDLIAVLVSRVYSDDFAYNGKTAADIKSRRDGLRSLQIKLLDFEKEGEWLKYGELLYTTGTPDGEKWAKSLYDERVEYYGESFLSKYIIDGEVATDKMKEAYDDASSELERLSSELTALYKAYRTSYADADAKKFADAGVHMRTNNGYVVIFVEKDTLSSLKIAEKDSYVLSLASKKLFEQSLDGNTLADDVTGFACDKFGFSNLQNGYGVIESDAELISTLNSLIDTWKYTFDYIEITVRAESHIAQDELRAMNAFQVEYADYPARTVLCVRYTDIDLQALKALSNREDVMYISISEPLTAIDAEQIPAVEG